MQPVTIPAGASGLKPNLFSEPPTLSRACGAFHLRAPQGVRRIQSL